MLVSLTCFMGIMWLTSYGFYTSVGLDLDRLEGSRVRYTYLRVRWPGDGSFRIGGGFSYRALSNGPLEPFDLGGTFFQPARRSAPHSFWNHLGFWWVDETDEQAGKQEARALWLGIPSWLLPLLTGLLVHSSARYLPAPSHGRVHERHRIGAMAPRP